MLIMQKANTFSGVRQSKRVWSTSVFQWGTWDGQSHYVWRNDSWHDERLEQFFARGR